MPNRVVPDVALPRGWGALVKIGANARCATDAHIYFASVKTLIFLVFFLMPSTPKAEAGGSNLSGCTNFLSMKLQ